MTRKLPADDQVLLTLARTETYSQIAERYGCTLQAVSFRLCRAGIQRRTNPQIHRPVEDRALCLLDLIIRYKRANDGCPPTYRHLAARMGNISTSTVTRYVRLLEDRNLIAIRRSGQICVVGARWLPPDQGESNDPIL